MDTTLDTYSLNLIKVYETDIKELANEKKTVIKKLKDIETEIVKKRLFIKQIKGEQDKQNERLEDMYREELENQKYIRESM